MWRVIGTNLRVLWSGSKLDSFSSARGLCQGDMLSPYPFVLCIEKLALKTHELVQTNQYNSISLSRGAPPLSYLLFADDILLFCRGDEDRARLVEKTLFDFCVASNLKFNLQKFRFIKSPRVYTTIGDNIKHILGISCANSIGKYMWHKDPASRVVANDFHHVVDKVQAKVGSWKSKLLNKVGKMYLAKYIIASNPIYTMQAYWIL